MIASGIHKLRYLVLSQSLKPSAHVSKELSKIPREEVSSAVSSRVWRIFGEKFASRGREESIKPCLIIFDIFCGLARQIPHCVHGLLTLRKSLVFKMASEMEMVALLASCPFTSTNPSQRKS